MNKEEVDKVVGRARFALANGVNNPNWDESKHPRGADGRFGSGGGAASTQTKQSKPEGWNKEKSDQESAVLQEIEAAYDDCVNNGPDFDKYTNVDGLLKKLAGIGSSRKMMDKWRNRFDDLGSGFIWNYLD